MHQRLGNPESAGGCDGHHKMSDSVVLPVNRFTGAAIALRQCGLRAGLNGEDHEQD
jgi:hypothetical protein